VRQRKLGGGVRQGGVGGGGGVGTSDGPSGDRAIVAMYRTGAQCDPAWHVLVVLGLVDDTVGVRVRVRVRAAVSVAAEARRRRAAGRRGRQRAAREAQGREPSRAVAAISIIEAMS
jgi:hypothetical protein